MSKQWSSVRGAECSGVPERPAAGRRHRGPPFPCVRLRDLRGQYDAGPRWAAVRELWFDSGDRAPSGPRSLDQNHVQPPTDATPARPLEWNRSARRPCQTAGHRSGLRPFHLIYIAGEEMRLGDGLRFVGQRPGETWIGERGRIRTCDPRLKRVANTITNNNLHVQLTPCATQQNQ